MKFKIKGKSIRVTYQGRGFVNSHGKEGASVYTIGGYVPKKDGHWLYNENGARINSTPYSYSDLVRCFGSGEFVELNENDERLEKGRASYLNEEPLQD